MVEAVIGLVGGLLGGAVMAQLLSWRQVSQDRLRRRRGVARVLRNDLWFVQHEIERLMQGSPEATDWHLRPLAADDWIDLAHVLSTDQWANASLAGSRLDRLSARDPMGWNPIEVDEDFDYLLIAYMAMDRGRRTLTDLTGQPWKPRYLTLADGTKVTPATVEPDAYKRYLRTDKYRRAVSGVPAVNAPGTE